MSTALRLIDANANRAREALRVMEDVARFALDDAALCRELKAARHELRDILGTIPGGDAALLARRDTPGDVGTSVSTEDERSRSGLRDVAAAASGRLTEALRVIEESLKTLPPPRSALEAGDRPERGSASRAAGAVEFLRYRAYDLERRLLLAFGAGRVGFTGWRCCVLLTESLCAHHDWETVAKLALEAGADCIQLREKELADRELLRRAGALRAMTRKRCAALVVNDRPDIALLAGADGVHLGQSDFSVEDVRRLAGDELLVGVSTSNVQEAAAAQRAGADVCGVGPMFPTTTKRKDRLAGPAALGAHLQHDPPLPPALAIGGITPENIGELIDAAAGRPFGVAISACVCAAPAPGAVVADILRALTDAIEEKEAAWRSNSSEPRSTTG